METIVITRPEFDKVRDCWTALPDFRCVPAPNDEASLAAAIRRESAKYAVIGTVRYTGELYDALPSGGVLARFGVGYDGVDRKRAAERGIFCTNTPGVLDQSVAECAAGMLLLAARHFVACVEDNRRGVWQNRVGVELAGKTLAIIGCGNIGSRFAAIARHGFGMTVVGFVATAPRRPEFFHRITRDFAEAAAAADFVSLHLPARPETQNFIDAERLRQFKPGAWLLNTARGAVVDEAALYDAAATGRLGGAVLDVFRREPYQPEPGRDLRTLPNILPLPHLGSSTVEACRRMAEALIANLRHARDGRPERMTRLPG